MKIRFARRADKVNKKGEKDFIESVSRYTDNFRFLAESKLMDNTINGNRNEGRKLKNYNEYKRVEDLQLKITNAMKYNKDNELNAIKVVLKDEKKSENYAESEILKKRLKVLKSKDENFER